MKKISRREFLTVAGIVGAAGALSACGAASSSAASLPASSAASSAASGSDAVSLSAEITWWAFPTFSQENADDPAGTYEQKIIDAFQAKYPNIKVNLETIDFTSGPDAIVAAMEGGTAPDVLFDAPGRIIDYGRSGKLVPLDDLFTSEFTQDVSSSALLDACKGNGTAYMYPLSTAPFFMVINKAMWKDSGALDSVNLDGDRTWTTEQLGTALQKLHDAGYMPGTVFCSGQGGDQGTRAFIYNLYDASFTDEAMTKYTMDSDAGIKCLQQTQDWLNAGLLGNGVAYNGGGDIENFVNGSTAFTFCWGTSTQLANQATLDANGIETVSLPFASADGKPSLEYLVNGFCVFDNGDDARAAAAKLLIQFICDDETWGKQDVVRTGAFPVRSSYGSLYSATDKAEEYKLLASWTDFYGPYTPTMPGWATQRSEWWNMLQAITNGTDVSTAAKTYAENSNAAITA